MPTRILLNQRMCCLECQLPMCSLSYFTVIGLTCWVCRLIQATYHRSCTHASNTHTQVHSLNPYTVTNCAHAGVTPYLKSILSTLTQSQIAHMQVLLPTLAPCSCSLSSFSRSSTISRSCACACACTSCCCCCSWASSLVLSRCSSACAQIACHAPLKTKQNKQTRRMLQCGCGWLGAAGP